jgi:hypothetical protein
MKGKAKKSRSINIRLSMRTYNDIEEILAHHEENGPSRKERSHAAMVRRRLERAPRSR